ncbi:MAG: hypothetical protein JRG71_03940 [Deltaproteobacteria bacterium]|nr:hypothetical protein [Deltaproteobacteria bacterium]
MKNIIWACIIVSIMFSPVCAEETYEDLSNTQFRLECSNDYGQRYTYANEPQKSKYFLFGPNSRIRDKGVMDLGAYKKGTIKLVRGGGLPDRVEITFSSETEYGYDGKQQTRFYKATYFNYKTLMEETAVLDSNNNLYSAMTENLKKCQSIGLPW